MPASDDQGPAERRTLGSWALSDKSADHGDDIDNATLSGNMSRTSVHRALSERLIRGEAMEVKPHFFRKIIFEVIIPIVAVMEAGFFFYDRERSDFENAKGISVYQNDEKVKSDVYLAKVTIWNGGNVSLENTDFASKISIVTKESARILSFSKARFSPRILDKDGSSVKIIQPSAPDQKPLKPLSILIIEPTSP